MTEERFLHLIIDSVFSWSEQIMLHNLCIKNSKHQSLSSSVQNDIQARIRLARGHSREKCVASFLFELASLQRIISIFLDEGQTNQNHHTVG